MRFLYSFKQFEAIEVLGDQAEISKLKKDIDNKFIDDYMDDAEVIDTINDAEDLTKDQKMLLGREVEKIIFDLETDELENLKNDLAQFAKDNRLELKDLTNVDTIEEILVNMNENNQFEGALKKISKYGFLAHLTLEGIKTGLGIIGLSMPILIPVSIVALTISVVALVAFSLYPNDKSVPRK